MDNGIAKIFQSDNLNAMNIKAQHYGIYTNEYRNIRHEIVISFFRNNLFFIHLSTTHNQTNKNRNIEYLNIDNQDKNFGLIGNI